jgi:hypothetical protein
MVLTWARYTPRGGALQLRNPDPAYSAGAAIASGSDRRRSRSIKR